MTTPREAARAEAQPGTILVVVHDFKARSADELSLSKGDRIELIERDDDFGDGWFLGKHIVSGTSGLFPEVYTAVAPRSTIAQANGLRRTSGSMPHAVQAQESTSILQRPASASTINTSQRPISATSTFSSKPTTFRSSLPADTTKLNLQNTQSPVMHETLTVIDEHMNDMNPATIRAANRRDTMSSMYSIHPNRMSYIAGHETEDEEGQMYTEAEVMRWTSTQVAEYLEDHGVEKSHCRVFKEQEITGEVLLAMDQSSVFLKEFDLGPVGRRLRTWHKIKALQDEAQRNTGAGAVSKTPDVVAELEANEPVRNRSTSVSSASASKTVAPLRSSTQQFAAGPLGTSPRNSIQFGAASGTSPLLAAPARQDSTYRPSAQSIRNMQHWRHSSVDSTAPSLDGSMHRKQSSTDQRLQAGRSANHSHTASTETAQFSNKEVVASPSHASPLDIDKGYFSSTEADSRSRRNNVLQKKHSPSVASSTHSRSGSLLNYARRSTTGNRAASTDSFHDPPVNPASSPNLISKTIDSRTISMPVYGNKLMSTVNESTPPMVTKLEPASPNSAGTPSASPQAGNESTATRHLAFFSKTSKIPGMRAISDAVTNREKSSVPEMSPTKDGQSTPSTSAASFDLKSGSRTSAGSANAMTPQTAPRRPKTKTKKTTSAYTRGLEKKSPAEQMIDCDYSGWMKKKSGSLMTTWKPRLFVLRGRRLSYYYAEDDDEEKGLIDISFHNVMPAMDERLTNMHAAVTGAGGASPSNPADTLTTTAQQEMRNNPPVPGTDDDGLFIFKLTPPKSGRGVNFTKPTVHYFAVNSRQEGRLWMAALMKAVIDRDQDSVVTTSYNQQTISLAKARARRERPPALKDDEPRNLHGLNGDGNVDGLGIGGLRTNEASTLGGADGTDRSYMTEDGESVVASSVPTAAPSIVTDLGELDKDQLVQTVH